MQSNQTWERFDGPRYHNQSYSWERCEEDARELQVHGPIGVRYSRGGASETETRSTTWGPDGASDEGHGHDSRSSGSSSSARTVEVTGAGARLEAGESCAETSSASGHGYAKPDGSWSREERWSSASSRCWFGAAASFGDHNASVGEERACASSRYESEEHVEYESNSSAYTSDYQEDAFSRECSGTTGVHAGEHGISHTESSSCSGERHYRDAETYRPDPWQNQIERWERDCSNATTLDAFGIARSRSGEQSNATEAECFDAPEYASESCHAQRSDRNGTSVEAAGTRVFHGEQSDGYAACWDERDGSERWCYFDGSRSEGTSVEAGGSRVFLGDRWDEDQRWCHESYQDCEGRFHGASLEAGDVRHDQALPE